MCLLRLMYSIVLPTFLTLFFYQSSDAKNIIRVSSKRTMPFSYPQSDTDTKWTGYSIEVFEYCINNKMVTDGNIVYDDYEVVTPSGKITGNDAGFAHLNANHSDIYIAAPTMTFAREKVVDFTIPYFFTGLGVMTTESDSSAQTRAVLVTLFSPSTLWILFSAGSALWAVACIVWTLEMVGNQELKLKSKKFFSSHPFWGMTQALSWSFMTLVKPTMYRPPNHPVSKRIGSLLSMLTIVVAGTLTSLVTTAMLAQPAVLINNVNDLKNVKLQAYIPGTSAASALDTLMMTNTKTYTHFDAAVAAVKSGEVQAFVYDKPMLEYQVRIQVEAVNAAKEKINSTNLKLKTLEFVLQPPEEYGFVLREHGNHVLRENLGECVLRFKRDGNLDAAIKAKYFVPRQAMIEQYGDINFGGLLTGICLLTFPTAIALWCVKKLRNSNSEKDEHLEISKMKMARLGLVRNDDLFEVLCAIMEGQADIMDLVYRSATVHQTYDGKSITMKEILDRQARLFKTKSKILHLRQEHDIEIEKVKSRVSGITSDLKNSIASKHFLVKVAWSNVKNRIKYSDTLEKQTMEEFFDCTLSGHFANLDNKNYQNIAHCHKIWNKVKDTLENKSSFVAIDNFFETMQNAHEVSELRWNSVWNHMHNQAIGGVDITIPQSSFKKKSQVSAEPLRSIDEMV